MRIVIAFTYTNIRIHKIQKSLSNQPDTMLMPQVLCMKIDEQVDLLVKKIGHKLLFKKKKFQKHQ